jgi:metal transporter CNNM
MFPNGSVFSDWSSISSSIASLMSWLPNLESLPRGWLWAGIVLCIVQSAMFSGLNLAVFSLSQLRLKIEADGGNADATRVLDLRKNSNQLLATIVWGNISTNVLLTLLSDSVLAGVAGFLFSAFVLTMLGEIIPQAYFSRNALRMTARFLPFLSFYRFVLYPLAKPTALLLDTWLGDEGVNYFRERDVRSLIALSAASGGDISKVEAAGARNFLDLDDIPVTDEGETVHTQSIISLPLANRRCILPAFTRSPDDPFLRKLDASGKKWVIVTNPEGEPEFVLDSHWFIRDALFNQLEMNPGIYWHRPIIVRDMKMKLGDVIGQMKVLPERPDDDVIHHDIILVWGAQRRIITGSDLLGRLLRGIATVVPAKPQPAETPEKAAKAAGAAGLATATAHAGFAGPAGEA